MTEIVARVYCKRCQKTFNMLPDLESVPPQCTASNCTQHLVVTRVDRQEEQLYDEWYTAWC